MLGVGSGRLLPLGLGGLFHQLGVGMETGIFATEGGELLVGGRVPDFAEIDDISCHALDDRRARNSFIRQLAHAEVHRRCELTMAGRLLRLLVHRFSSGHRDRA